MKSIERVGELLSELTRLIGKSGSKIQPFENPSLPIFTAMDPERQKLVSALLEDLTDFLNEAFADGVDPLDTATLLRRSLLHFNWSPVPDIYDYIGPDDTIELCDLAQVGLFRNLQCYKFVSLTLEQLYCLPWHQFSRRSDQDQAVVAGAVGRILSGEVRGTLSLADSPEQIIQEVNTPELRQLRLKFRCISPVYSGGKLVGLIAVHHTSFVSKI